MKKFILRVVACFMMAAMIGICMGNAKTTLAADVEVAHTGSVDMTGNASWWNQNEMSKDELLGDVAPEDVEYIRLYSDKTFTLGYNSAAGWTQVDKVTEKNVDNIDFGDSYVFAIILNENDTFSSTINWEVYVKAAAPAATPEVEEEPLEAIIVDANNNQVTTWTAEVGGTLAVAIGGIEDFSEEKYSYTWISNAPEVAKVDQKGNCIAVAEGSATISVAIVDNATGEMASVTPVNVTVTTASAPTEEPAETPVETPAADLVALNINERPFISGLAPTDNADGSVTFSGGTSMKASFMLPETLAAGESITVNVKLQFNSADDKAVRFYLIANASDVNVAAEIQTIENENTGNVIEKTFVMTAASDATELLFASSSYGTYIKDVTIYDITLGEKPAAPTAPAATPEITGDEYVVAAGDTLRAIAKAAGVTVEELAAANGIENTDLIRKGAKLVIPAADTTARHVVVAGDTLSSIADAYGVTVADLVKANALENPDLIVVGQAILLP